MIEFKLNRTHSFRYLKSDEHNPASILKEKSDSSTLHLIITLIAFVALLAISLYSGLVCAFWIYAVRYSFVSRILGDQFFEILIITCISHFFVFLFLLFSAIRSKSLVFEPSQFLLYVIVFWVAASTFLVIETNPRRWDGIIRQIQDYVTFNPSSKATRQLISVLKCNDPTIHCWESIDLFVDSNFCLYASLFLPVYPLLLGCSIIFLI